MVYISPFAGPRALKSWLRQREAIIAAQYWQENPSYHVSWSNSGSKNGFFSVGSLFIIVGAYVCSVAWENQGRPRPESRRPGVRAPGPGAVGARHGKKLRPPPWPAPTR